MQKWLFYSHFYTLFSYYFSTTTLRSKLHFHNKVSHPKDSLDNSAFLDCNQALSLV